MNYTKPFRRFLFGADLLNSPVQYLHRARNELRTGLLRERHFHTPAANPKKNNQYSQPSQWSICPCPQIMRNLLRMGAARPTGTENLRCSTQQSAAHRHSTLRPWMPHYTPIRPTRLKAMAVPLAENPLAGRRPPPLTARQRQSSLIKPNQT
jgi:hypothetical protein